MNLSDNQTRSVRQQEQIGRRTSIIAERRDTRAPILETNANLRSARRGDVGGAEALMRTLGLLQNAGEDVANAQFAKYADQEQDNIAQGAADQAAGTVDEALMEKSLGYRNAVTKGRTVTAFSKASREFSEELEQLIEGQDSPILEDRQAEIEAKLEEFYTGFAADPETGELREFLQSPGAMRYLAEAIQTSRPAALANAMERVEERFNREALSHYSENIADQAVDTGTVDIEQARSLLPATVTDEQVAEATLVSVSNAAEALRARGRFQEAATLLAQLRGSYDKPVDAGAATAQPTGVAPTGGDVERLRMPVPGQVTSEFGASRGSGPHNGMDIAVPEGTPVPAALGGEIIRVWNDTSNGGGLSVKVRYDDGSVAGFAHLSDQPIKEGRFNAGDTIAITGNTGRSTGPHLHYTLTRDGQKINPLEADFGDIQSIDPNTEAAPAAPAARLRNPNADPITEIEQLGNLQPLKGLEGVTFSPQQQARINELYKATTDEMRAEWREANQERYTSNATNLALGIFGVDGRTTTMSDIRRAFADDEIDGDAVMTLIRLQEGREERREARAERAEARAEREENRRRDRVAKQAVENILGRMLNGSITVPEARAEALAAAASASDAEIGASILSSVMSVSSAMDNAVMKSEPVVRQFREFEEKADTAGSHIRTLLPRLPQHRYKAFEEQYTQALERAQGRYASAIASGTSPEVARVEVEAFMTNVEADIVTAGKAVYGPSY